VQLTGILFHVYHRAVPKDPVHVHIGLYELMLNALSAVQPTV